MSYSLPCCRVSTDGRRSWVAAPTGRTERNVRQRRLRTFENEAEAQQRPAPTVRGRSPLRDMPPVWGQISAPRLLRSGAGPRRRNGLSAPAEWLASAARRTQRERPGGVPRLRDQPAG